MPLSGDYVPGVFAPGVAQVELYERTNGAEGRVMDGRACIILRTIGNKTGALRKTPLMRVEHEGRYAVVASMGGSSKNPVWYHNIRAQPVVELQDGADLREYVAHEATGDERVEWWDRAVETFPPYGDYQKKTDRLIPVFILVPVSEA